MNKAVSTLIMAVLLVYRWEHAAAAPIAPSEARGRSSEIVILPLKVENVYQCGVDLLRKIEEYCVVKFDINVKSSQNRAYENSLKQMGLGEAGGEKREKRSDSRNTRSKYEQPCT